MSAYERVRPVLKQIANTYPRTTDVRNPGARFEVIDVLWWPSDAKDFAGDMLIWRGFETPPTSVPISLRYKRVCPLYRAVDNSDTYARSDELVYIDGVILRPNITDATIRNAMSFYNETLELVGAEPEPDAAAPPDSTTPVYGRAPSLRATATFPYTLGSFAFGGNVFRDPFNVFRDTFNIQIDNPQVKPVVFTVRHATGRWAGATNVIVGYVGHSDEPLQLMREIAVVRGLKE